MMTRNKSRCLLTFERKMMMPRPFYQQSKVYLCFGAFEAREGIISVVVRWQMLKITLLPNCYFIEICYTYRIVSATGEENRTMSQLIFNPNPC